MELLGCFWPGRRADVWLDVRPARWRAPHQVHRVPSLDPLRDQRRLEQNDQPYSGDSGQRMSVLGRLEVLA